MSLKGDGYYGVSNVHWGPRGLGDLGRMAIAFQGAEEQTNSFGDLRSPTKK